MSIARRPSLKAIGRKRVCFHLDQLVYLSKYPALGGIESEYNWTCHMIESSAYHYGTGVMCGEMGIGYKTQFEAEEEALRHLQEMHLAMGGERRPKGRGTARRDRKRDEWNARHGRPPLRKVKDDEGDMQ